MQIKSCYTTFLQMKKSFPTQFLFLVLLGFFLLEQGFAQEIRPSETNQLNKEVTPHLFSHVDKIQGGDSFEVDLLFEIAPGWHLYWYYPGDAGFPPKVEWSLPEGWSASELEFSLPDQFSEPGAMTVYGYERVAWIRAQITPSHVLDEKKSWVIGASLSWLACSNLCVPGKSTLSLSVPVTLQEQHEAQAAIAPALWPSPGAPPFAITILHEPKSFSLSFKREEGSSYEFFPLPEVEASTGHVITTLRGGDIHMTIPWEG